MKILLTGATGFVGKNLVAELKKNHELHILVRPGSEWTNLGIEKVVEFSDDIASLANYMIEHHVDGVVHLASLYIAEHKSKDIKDLVMSNVFLGTALLEACKLSGVKWFINTGTIWQNYRVNDYSNQYNPVNLYAASKQAFITMAKFYMETTGIRFCTLKLCDTYGPNDTRRKIFKLFKDSAENGEILKMSPGEQKLDLLFISDVVQGFKHLTELLSSGEELAQEYVLSSGLQISLKEIAQRFEAISGMKLNIEWGGMPYREREVMNPWVGPVLKGWYPCVSLDEGIRMFITS